MKIYDISQEVLSCRVYPGDPVPIKETLASIDNGDLYNLTAFSMCVHNGTHIDAPYHFINEGETVEKIALSKLVGLAYVAEHNGILKTDDAVYMLEKASKANAEAAKRILVKGDVIVSREAAEVFATSNICLVGNESQTVGPEDSPLEVHKILLEAGVILLEGIRLENVEEGVYLLNAAPISLAGCDGSPCRAILIDIFEKL